MQTIDFKITKEQLQEVNECFIGIHLPLFGAREYRIAKSILDVLSIKLLKKTVNKHDASKPFKISLEYYEAHYLEQLLIHCNKLYYSNERQKIVDILNQQLN